MNALADAQDAFEACDGYSAKERVTRVLAGLGYDDDPAKLQYIIATLYERIAAKGFDVDGVEVRPFPLFKVLDGKSRDDYEQRVEPSVQGGRKLAQAFVDVLFPATTS